MSNDTVSSLYRDIKSDFAWSVSRPRRPLFARISPIYLVSTMAAVDFILITGISLAMVACCAGFYKFNAANYVYITLVVAFASLFLFKNDHLYKVELIARSFIGAQRIAKIWTFTFLFLAAAGVLTKTSEEYSRLWCMSWYAVGLVALIAHRVAAGRFYNNAVAKGRIRHSVVVLGGSALTSNLLKRISANPHGVKVEAIFDDVPGVAPLAGETAHCNGNLDDLLMYQKLNDIDTLVVAAPMAADARVRKIVSHFGVEAIKVRLLPGQIAMDSSSKWYAPLGEIPGIQLVPISDRPIALWGYLLKSAFDRTFALLALIILAPLLLACVIGIKLSSPGPVLFLQKRIGYRNRLFYVYKFRSMHMSDCNLLRLTERNDPRIFGFGQILRKLSLDELPQLFNVLKGEMSLVGPRPHMPEARAAGRFYFDVVTEYASRHRVKPGITGWAQVNGWRGPTETVEQIEQRVSHDLYYIENWSLSLDVAIIAKTMLVGFFGKNAF